MRIDISNLQPGETIVVSGKWWGVCCYCWKLVRIDKPMLGSAHFCVSRTERHAGYQTSGCPADTDHRDGGGSGAES